MFDNAYGCAGDAVSIKRNAFLAVFTSLKLIFLNFKISKFLYQVFVLHLISPMKVKSCWAVEHNTSKYRLEKCQFNIGSYATHSVLDTPDLWANILVYVTVEFPICYHCLFVINISIYSCTNVFLKLYLWFYRCRYNLRESLSSTGFSVKRKLRYRMGVESKSQG